MITALLLLQATILAQAPCTQQEASQKPGAWGKNPDDLAMADSTFPKQQYASALRRADQAIALLKQAVPSLTGVEAKPYRSIRGQSYVVNGPVPFALNVPVFDYHCIPQTSGDPSLRGKVQLSGETGTWIYFYFNSVGWLANERMVRGHTVSGARIYEMAKQNGELKGFPLLLPELNVGSPDEAIIITPDGRSPFKPLSREKFLLAEQKHYQDELDKLQKMSPVPVSGVAQRQSELAAINSLLNSLSPEEKQAQAIVNYRYGFSWGRGRQKVFVTEAEGGEPLVTLDAALFKPTSPRTAATIITVYWRVDKSNAAKSAVIRQFKENFDFQALRQLLDR